MQDNSNLQNFSAFQSSTIQNSTVGSELNFSSEKEKQTLNPIDQSIASNSKFSGSNYQQVLMMNDYDVQSEKQKPKKNQLLQNEFNIDELKSNPGFKILENFQTGSKVSISKEKQESSEDFVDPDQDQMMLDSDESQKGFSKQIQDISIQKLVEGKEQVLQSEFPGDGIFKMP